jgi:hypothetical protein
VGGFRLSEPAPNPVRDRTSVTVTLDRPQDLTVGVFDVLGRRVASLHEGALTAGAHPFTLDFSSLPAGVYVARATGDGSSAAVRVVVAR